MLTPTFIICILLGLLAYWTIKGPAEVKGAGPVNNATDFLKVYWRQLVGSAIGATLLILNGPVLPFGAGTIDGVIPAFIAGGSIPSMINNIVAMFKKADSSNGNN